MIVAPAVLGKPVDDQQRALRGACGGVVVADEEPVGVVGDQLAL